MVNLLPLLLLLENWKVQQCTVYKMQSTEASLTFQLTLNLRVKERKSEVAT